MILKYKTAYKMNFRMQHKIELLRPSCDLGSITIQVHEYGQ